MQTNATYDTATTFTKVLGKLVSLRAKASEKRHDLHFWNQFNLNSEPVEVYHAPIDEMMPPRRKWIRPRKNKRKECSSSKIWEHSLFSTIMAYQAKDQLDNTEWGQRLLDQINAIQTTWSDPDKWHLSSPKVDPKREDGKIRLIAQYENITDRVVLSFSAKYLSQALTHLWCPQSYAFRPAGTFGLRPAVESILAYSERFTGQPLYVAECDIQQFFDSISHDIIGEHFSATLQRAEQAGSPVDPRAKLILERYLGSYDFAKSAIPAVQAYNQAHPANSISVHLPLGLEQFYGDSFADRAIGIPQGGALSPLIANVVMDSVDRSVLSGDDTDLFYARYCDDMILIHPDKDKCSAALARYMFALKALKLLPHIPAPFSREMPNSEPAKSKSPYLWTPDPGPNMEASESILFLGYKIRRDGTLALREKTIKNHKGKMHRLAHKAMKIVTRQPADDLQEQKKKSPPSGKANNDSPQLRGGKLLKKIRLRMVTGVVGRENLMQEGCMPRQPCWASAFDLLACYPSEEAIRQLKELDCGRERKIRYLAKLFNAIGIMPPKPEQNHKSRKKKKFYGAPFSYYSIAGKTSRRVLKSWPGTHSDYLHYNQM